MARAQVADVPRANRSSRNAYGLTIAAGQSELDVFKFCFAHRHEHPDLPPRRELFRYVADRMLPGYFEWHKWTWDVVDALCGSGLVAFSGCSGSAKTRNVAGFLTVWWLCAPEISSACFVSTTVKSLRRRGWAEIQRAHSMLDDTFGNMIDSRTLWQCKQGDDRHAIVGRAVEEGSVTKVADDIKGVHTRRQAIAIDEATSVPEAIYDASANLFSYPEDFLLVTMANPRHRLDSFGRFCEPEGGWTSVNVETPTWTARPFSACGGKKPVVVRFDAEHSPNITEGKTVSAHLPTRLVVANAKAHSGGTSPHYWTNFRGFWPPEGLVKTVFSESALYKFDAFGRHRFSGENFQIIGACDPAYGGDRAVLRFAKVGVIARDVQWMALRAPGAEEPSQWGIELMAPIILPVDATSRNPIHYQLAEQLKRECETVDVGEHRMSCEPGNLGVDDSGAGGLCDILARTWSANVMRVEFGARPSEEPCSLEDARPACDVYRNKRAEMFFRARGALDTGQLKGMDADTALELCAIEFDDVGRDKIVLMSKADYKAKMGESCDLADTVAILMEVARRLGFRLAALGTTAESEGAVEQVFADNQAMYDPTRLYTPDMR